MGSSIPKFYTRMYSPRMSIGDRLDQAMKSAEFESQKALERASGVPQATISRILKGGGKKGPETETIRKLAAACNVSFEWLNEGTGAPTRIQTGAQIVSLVSNAPPVNEEVGADEIVDLINAYKEAPPKRRKMVLNALKTAAKRSSRKPAHHGPE